MKYLLFSTLLVACTGSSDGESAYVTSNQSNEISIPMEKTSFYDLSATTIDGQNFDFTTLKGKRVLLVNVASKCGYTSQYEGLQELHSTYGSDEFVIIGFPSNDFGGQEPGTNGDIKTFCSKNYGVSFLMANKVSVKGKDIDPLFKWLNSQENQSFVGDIMWNFEKYLIDENGHLVKRFRSSTKPDSDKIISLL